MSDRELSDVIAKLERKIKRANVVVLIKRDVDVILKALQGSTGGKVCISMEAAERVLRRLEIEMASSIFHQDKLRKQFARLSALAQRNQKPDSGMPLI